MIKIDIEMFEVIVKKNILILYFIILYLLFIFYLINVHRQKYFMKNKNICHF